MKRVVIIGAGISGLFFANLLKQNEDYSFTIYEKNGSIDLEKGYGIQLSVNSVKLLHKIGFQNISSQDKFNPNKLDFYSFKNNKKICELNISLFNENDLKYTTMQRSTLIEFLKDRLPANLINYNKKVVEVDQSSKILKIKFEDNSLVECEKLIISDGIFSTTKSLVANKVIKPKYFNSIAVRANIKRDIIKNINTKNISLFLGSNLHSVLYPIDQSNELNFISILRKNLNHQEQNNYSLFNEKGFISSVLSELSNQVDNEIIHNLKDIKCFPIFTSKKIYYPNNKDIFLIGDAFFAFPPTFAQGASQSIEVAYELYKTLNIDKKKFHTQRSKRTKMINNRSRLNYFIFHISNPLIVFIRNVIIKYLVRNIKFINVYLGKIYKY